ncbi:constitutive coactivator of peroxisome proliferator-activated receptor gamma-like isoform X2 [Branchiostoma floridae x Branchiostoma belcheri]
MGVKGLQTYVEKNCPHACEKVSLRSLAQDYQAEHGKTPVLVVDGLSCLRDHFYHSGLAWVYGGQWQEYLTSLRKFVQDFQSAGIEVVFIFDGVVEKSKRPVWISRRKTELKTVRKIFQHIRATGKEPHRSLLHLPPAPSLEETKLDKNSKCPIRHVRPDISAEILQEAKRRHQNTENIKAIYEILTVAEGDSGVHLEEADSGIPAASVFYRPIREKLHGVLYGVGVKQVTGTAPGVDQCSRQMSGLVIGGEEIVVGRNAAKDWSAHPGAELREPDIILAKPLDMPGGTPTLEALWFGPGVRTVALQWKAFRAGMFCTIPTDRSKAIPKNLTVLVVVLHYMLSEGVLGVWEVDAFLIQALLYPDWYKFRRRMVPVDPRAVQLAALFLKGVAVAIAMNCACGWPLTMESCLPWGFFDGKFFHHVYLQVRGGTGARDLCGRNESQWQLFQLLKDCVSHGQAGELGRQSGKTQHPCQPATTRSYQEAANRTQEASRPVSMSRTLKTVSYRESGEFGRQSWETHHHRQSKTSQEPGYRTQKEAVRPESIETVDSVSYRGSDGFGRQSRETHRNNQSTSLQQSDYQTQKKVHVTGPESMGMLDGGNKPKDLSGSAMSSEQSKKRKRNRRKKGKN